MHAGAQINMKLLLEFCRQKFSPEEYKSLVTEFAGYKVGTALQIRCNLVKLNSKNISLNVLLFLAGIKFE